MILKVNRTVVRRTVAGVDWGYTNPGVVSIFAVDGDGRMYLIREHYYSQRMPDWWVERAKEFKALYAPEAYACDPAEPAFIQGFRNAGLNAIPAFNDIAPGVNNVRQRLEKAGDGRPRLFLSRNALVERDPVLVESKRPTCTAEEIDSYVLAKGQDGKPIKEEPVDRDNHGLDALRYACAYVDGLGKAKSQGNAWVGPPRPSHSGLPPAIPGMPGQRFMRR